MERTRKRSHIKCNCSAVTVVFITSSDTKYNQMGSYMCTFTRPFPLNIVSFSENLQWQNLTDYILPNWQIFCDNKKQTLLAKTLWICDFHSLWQFWTFSSTSGAATAHMLSTSVQLPPGFCWCLCLPRIPLLWFFFGSTLSSNLLWVLVSLIFCSYQSPVRLPLNPTITVFFLSRDSTWKSHSYLKHSD